ncbi:hypothetical protein NUW58_g3197 [Xylaria curta]|uniref:Uncharacterized protein n=1 Tax=Xylaria curta TaxID=42375 RepID=A0ACC1PC14_9PEZI|nr:hypothetical protein NUW58_g3197 [Xylaria curta]
MSSVENVEFKTVDGVTLRGKIYHATQPGPGIVMCPGFNGVKDLGGLPELAEAFQKADITALLYDPRSVGSSEGKPRNHIDPFKQIEDYSDALSFLGTYPNVDPDQVGLWGISLSAGVALSVAAFDKRAKFVIAVCPVAEYQYEAAKMGKILRACFKDRESQVKGNPPFYVSMVGDDGQSPAGLEFGHDRERAAEWAKRGVELAAHHVNQTTVQSYHKIAMWHPWPMWKHIAPTPVLFLVPEQDTICPPEEQLRHYNDLEGPKVCHLRKGKGHLDLLEGEDFGEVAKLQVDFLWDAFGDKIS